MAIETNGSVCTKDDEQRTMDGDKAARTYDKVRRLYTSHVAFFFGETTRPFLALPYARSFPCRVVCAFATPEALCSLSLAMDNKKTSAPPLLFADGKDLLRWLPVVLHILQLDMKREGAKEMGHPRKRL